MKSIYILSLWESKHNLIPIYDHIPSLPLIVRHILHLHLTPVALTFQSLTTNIAAPTKAAIPCPNFIAALVDPGTLLTLAVLLAAVELVPFFVALALLVVVVVVEIPVVLLAVVVLLTLVEESLVVEDVKVEDDEEPEMEN